MNDSANIKELHENLHEEIITNFIGILDSFNYRKDIQLLDISVFNFRQKKNMVIEFQGLYIGLWSMALYHSFPQDYDIILQKFMDRELPKRYNKRLLSLQVKRINQYIELIRSNSTVDFTPVSHHILSLLHTKESESRKMNLKIALHIRSIYNYIFERLF